MSRVWTLFSYKLRFFFGSSVRGRFGPLPFIGLSLLFVFYGFLFGFGYSQVLKSATVDQAGNLLTAPLSALMALGFLYALGAGVTAHVSEFDFFMTAEVRPREYLLADLVFQFASLLGSGGLGAAVAAVGIVLGLGRPLWTVGPLFATLLAFVFLVLLAIQILVVLRVRYPKAPVRAATFALFVLALLPSVSLVVPGVSLNIQGLPVPASAFGSLGAAALLGAPVDPVLALVAAGWFGAILLVWVALSNTYFFHGIRPSLSAGFGQVDMAARMDQQRRMIGRLGGLTTRIRLRTERGGDTGLMTRFHLIRIWRDGSVFFVILFAAISVVSVNSGGSEGQASAVLVATQLLALIPVILALNWSYYERENLWIALMGRRAPAAYFRGLMAALALIGVSVAGVFLLLFEFTFHLAWTVEEMALPLAAPVASAFVATALVTKLRIKPAAFSPAMFALLIFGIIGGFIGGLAAQGVVHAARLLLDLGAEIQATLLGAVIVALAAAGLWGVTRLGSSFRL